MNERSSSISLRPLRLGDEEAAVRWSRDAAFCAANDWQPNLPAERVQKHWQKLITSPPAGLLRLGVLQGERLIGYVDLAGQTAETGELGIAIGESALWGQGVGAAACQLMLAHAFEQLDLPEVTAEVHAPNTRSRRLMNKLGFTEIGQVGEEIYQGESVPLIGFLMRRDAWAFSRPTVRTG